MRVKSLLSWAQLVAALAVILLAAGSADAQEEHEPTWSFGVGAGTLFPTYQSFLGNLVLPVTYGTGTPVTMTVETRLGPNLWLGLHADVLKTSSESKPMQTNEAAVSKGSGTSIIAGLGLRYVVNPGSIVEFSPLLVVGITSFKYEDTQTSTQQGTTNEERSTESYLGPTGGIGFSAESFLGRGLSVRLATLLLSASTVKTTSEHSSTYYPDNPRKYSGTRSDIGLTLSPTIELRVSL